MLTTDITRFKYCTNVANNATTIVRITKLNHNGWVYSMLD